MNTRDITNIDQLANHIFSEPFYKEYCERLCGVDTFLSDELFSEFVELTITMDKDKLFSLCKSNQFRYYATGIIKNIVYNEVYQFNKNYDTRKTNNTVSTDDVDELLSPDEDRDYFNQDDTVELLKQIGEFLEDEDRSKCSWYENKVMDMYFNEYNSYREMSKAVDIHPASLNYSVKKCRKAIKREFQDKYNRISLDSTGV